jgi:TRAP-type C4-dicarboxylate transport system permease small subunit
MIAAVEKAVAGLLAFTRSVSAICLMASVLINFANIIGRYFFSISIPWAEEIMLFLMVGCVFTGCCAVAWQGRQIKMDVLVSLLPPTLHHLLALLSELVMIAAAIVVTLFALPVISNLWAFDERSQAANFPLVIPQAMVPIGYMLMGLLVATRLLIAGRRSGVGTGADPAQH